MFSREKKTAKFAARVCREEKCRPTERPNDEEMKTTKTAHHLEGGQVLLPPDELLVLGSHGGHHVVEIHDNVHERVQKAEEGRVAAGSEAHAEPDAHRHDAVVDHVQQRNVLVFLAQHEEELKYAKRVKIKKRKNMLH